MKPAESKEILEAQEKLKSLETEHGNKLPPQNKLQELRAEIYEIMMRGDPENLLLHWYSRIETAIALAELDPDAYDAAVREKAEFTIQVMNDLLAVGSQMDRMAEEGKRNTLAAQFILRMMRSKFRILFEIAE